MKTKTKNIQEVTKKCTKNTLRKKEINDQKMKPKLQKNKITKTKILRNNSKLSVN